MFRPGWGLVLIVLVGACVPDEFTFGSGGPSAGAGGAGGAGGSNASSFTTLFSSSTGFEQVCGNGVLDPNEECDAGELGTPALLDEVGGPETLTPSTRGCTPECEYVLAWHTQLDAPGYTPVDMSIPTDAGWVAVASNGPLAQPGAEIAAVERVVGTVAETLEQDDTVIHSMFGGAAGLGLAVLATNVAEPMAPETFLFDLLGPSTVELPLDFDATAFDRYGRIGDISIEPNMNRFGVVGSVAGEATLVMIEYGGVVESFPLGLMGMGPGTVAAPAGSWRVAWGGALADFVMPDTVAPFDVLPPGAVVRGICRSIGPRAFVVGDIEDGGSTRGAIWYLDPNGILASDELPAPSRIAAVDCLSNAFAVVAGEISGLAFTRRYDAGFLEAPWTRLHAGPGFLPASATAIALGEGAPASVYVAGWHEDENGKRQPWVRKYRQ